MPGGRPDDYISACSEMTEQPLSSTAAAAKALGHPTRLRLLTALSGGPLCVCQMTALLGTAPSTVSEHLRDLKRAGLVVEEKSGKFVFYRLSASRNAACWLQAVRAGLAGDPVAAADAEIIARLRRVPVEEFAASGGRLPVASGPRLRRLAQRRA
jgi:ArsR family transcriptional regulator, arsenate/arsenite/antimonite-responsive transcriptional repressor